MTYSSAMALGRQPMVTRGQNSVTFQQKDKRLGPVSNTIVLIVLACLLGLLYLTQVTKTNAYGYKINSLQKQQSSLQQQHDDLSIASARSQSIDRTANSPATKNLTSATPAGSVE